MGLNWVPRCATWLGFDINLESTQLVVPKSKIEALQGYIQQALNSNYISAGNIARITGRIISMLLALGPNTRFMTRRLYALLSTRHSWCHVKSFTRSCTRTIISVVSSRELQWSKHLAHSISSSAGLFWHQQLWQWRVYYRTWAQIAHGQWSSEEATQSSTWRELFGVQRVLESIAGSL